MPGLFIDALREDVGIGLRVCWERMSPPSLILVGRPVSHRPSKIAMQKTMVMALLFFLGLQFGLEEIV
jgi:hypothetical protein